MTKIPELEGNSIGKTATFLVIFVIKLLLSCRISWVPTGRVTGRHGWRSALRCGAFVPGLKTLD